VTKLTDILDQLSEDIDGDDISLGDVVEQFKSRGYGPLLFLPAVAVISPIGTVPTLPTFCAVFMLLVTAQLLFGRSSPWLPAFLAKRALSKDRVRQSVKQVRSWAEWVDGFLGDRLDALTNPVADRIVALTVILLCITVPPLELVPFAALVPNFCICVFAIGLTVRDGVVTLLGFLFSISVGVLLWWLLPQIWEAASSLFGWG